MERNFKNPRLLVQVTPLPDNTNPFELVELPSDIHVEGSKRFNNSRAGVTTAVITPLTVDERGRIDTFQEHEGIQYWKAYFDFAYYTLVSPFRFQWDSKGGIYICHTSGIQKILRKIVFTVFGVCYLLRLRFLWVTSRKNEGGLFVVKPSAYFDMAVYFFDSFFMLLLFAHIGRQREKVFDVFKKHEAGKLGVTLMLNSENNKCTKVRIWATAILTCCMITVGIKLLEMLANQGEWNLPHFFQQKTAESKIMFVEGSLVESIPWLFIFLNVMSTLYEKILNDFGDILFTMTVLFFKNLVDKFEKEMKLGNNPHKVLEQYNWIKEVASQVNDAIGIMTFAFIVGNLPFFATSVLDVGSPGTETFVRFRYIFACLYFFPSICIGAAANKKIEFIKEWISKPQNYQQVPDTKLLVFLHDLSYHTVGLTTAGIMTVTWNSVGSIVSIILTYAFLETQFQHL